MASANRIGNAKQQAKGKLKEVAGKATGNVELRDEARTINRWPS